MNYHIGTMLIGENFDGGKECPVCRIKRAVDLRLTEQYLGEGVMEDHTRAEVNALGFCGRHFSLLYSMRSKLGLALQASTRLNTVMKDLTPVKNSKQAKKQADEILGTVNRKVTQESLAFDMLQKESSDFRSKLISMYKEHLNLINDLPALAEEKLAEIEKKEAALAPKEDEKPEVEPEQEKIDEPDEPAENTEPEVIQEETDEKEDDDSGLERFSLSDIGPADEYDDISSDSRLDDDSDSGFSLNVSDAEFDDEDDSTENNSVAENDLSDDDSGEADDDEDDEPVSFKSFFKKK